MEQAAKVIVDTLFGRWRSRILYAGTRLGVFDAVTAHAHVPAAALAATLNVDAPLLYRLLRALASIGLLDEDAQRGFRASASGALLDADAPSTLRDFVLLQEGPEHYAIWAHLPDMVRDGRQNGFVREFGAMAFDYAKDHVRYRTDFKRAMSSFSTVQSERVVDALRDAAFAPGAEVCDIGGGQGHMLCSLLAQFPALSGIVFDLPEVIGGENESWAARMGVSARCRQVGGNMFDAVPAADVYLLKLILHDWNDDECVAILKRARQGARDGARVFVIERVVPGPDVAHHAKLYDIHMMCWGSGRERTRDEYHALLDAAGWRPAGIRHASDGQIDVIEALAA
ncbi:methyltransferase [Burkholderia stagnalis]|uniref:methyltransferase n=1 Tax=Burkholderia stagnalis TaxID=1503054 RepID=UPI000F59ED2C|nr:methyltransferase [Burkholderia stagnalis]RQQ09270.1 hydroxyneurosporene methyltransferase [Burkholderia stagnalis]RQQ09410.1 hydroxyneurosporene methyltransferase [Burkholderia stagnalis]RQQ27688.1 hydroxyneurosporene methyltransferase [Burkholderia stagnalis]RQQ96207.1 hydroxyneurosporene methyltransferase [Burkholderia stagnalis]RQX90043.1 hydroxyneurosporene methyltransferase [Burkholderia stagnalis]